MTSKLLGPDVGLTDLLDAAVLSKQEDELAQPARFLPLRPSASGYCARKLAYEYSAYHGLNEKIHEVKKAHTIRLLDLGHHIEKAALDQLYRAGMFKLKYKQQSLHFTTLDGYTLPDGKAIPSTHIEGSPDVVIEYHDGSVGLYDIKSKNTKFSSWRDNTWEESLWQLGHMSSVQRIGDSKTAFWIPDIMAFFDENHDESLQQNITQTNYYALNPFMQQRKVSFGGILRYAKNDSQIIELRFALSQERYDYVNAKFKEIHENASTPEKIKKEMMLGSQACAYCPYNVRCWPEINAKKEHYKTLPDKEWATDVDRLPPEISHAFDELQVTFDEAQKASSLLDKVKEKMLLLMQQVDKTKIKTSDGQVFEAKFLKSPQPHYDVRKGKV
jgi:hypothetical protein